MLPCNKIGVTVVPAKLHGDNQRVHDPVELVLYQVGFCKAKGGRPCSSTAFRRNAASPWSEAGRPGQWRVASVCGLPMQLGGVTDKKLAEMWGEFAVSRD